MSLDQADHDDAHNICAASNRTILVVDDEKPIRDLVAQMLECLGYKAITCANGEEAVSLYKDAMSSGNSFLTVVMDLVVVEGMGGKDAAQHILGIDPDARLIVSSGYSDDPVMADHKRYGFQALLPKPYTVRTLAEVLSSILSR